MVAVAVPPALRKAVASGDGCLMFGNREKDGTNLDRSVMAEAPDKHRACLSLGLSSLVDAQDGRLPREFEDCPGCSSA